MSQNNHSSIDNLIEQAIALGREAEADNAAGIEDFLRHYYSGIGEEDLEHCDPATLCDAALAHLKFGKRRKEKTAILRIYNPSPKKHGCRSKHTVLEMVSDDMPFLVDSLTLALNKYGLDIQLIIHPLYLCKRDRNGKLLEILPASITREGMVRESFQRFEIERITDPELISRVEKDALSALADVRLAVEDWPAMRAKAHDLYSELESRPWPFDEQVVSESKAFIKWLEDDHFTFLGYREYRYQAEDGDDVLYRVPGSGLGILRENGERGCKSTMALPKSIHKQTRARQALIITKANALSTIHRKGHMDYVAVKQFDEQGDIVGEKRFLGQFTTAAYNSKPQKIPLLRHKVRRVMEMSQLQADSHSGKELLHALDTFPRDELFQSSVEELHELATGVLHLQERQRVKLFVRRDPFGRFFSCLVYIPRDRYNTQVRHNVQNILMVALRGKTAESQVQMTESVLARVHYIIHTMPWDFSAEQIPIIEEKIAAAVRTWHDSLKESLIDKLGEEEGLQLFQHYGKALPVAYTEDVSAQDAVYDIMQMKELGNNEDSLRLSLYRPATYPETRMRLKLFRRDELIPIFEALPMLENMGLRVIYERPYTVELQQNSNMFIQDFEVEHDQSELNPKEVAKIFRDAFYRTWRGQIENDGFNRLVLKAKLTWRQAAFLRTCCKYLVQTGVPFSQPYMEATLASNAEIAGMLVELFETRFNPKLKKTRENKCETLVKKIKRKLDAVSSLDEDRILRSYLTIINACLRTNYFQSGKDSGHKTCISLKLDSKRIPDLPRPVPEFEIFVYSPRVEGIHLRGGKVARGGLRWSDRREDFRTEVLGLMKAQMVKNTVIVPVGAKGGFVVKKPPEGDRTALMAEVVDCYKIFVRGLLDLTDNIKEGKIVPPPKTVRYDGDDPYLVVAADKGTATFSDTANGISQEHSFWLGDAFASGGSEGYDHKKMGITARGAWESVKRLFREIGIDTENQDFTAAGIGDMAGDVFGNGMLITRHIKLQAAFNHMHIFLDPDPDPEKSYAERERLFKMPGSTWDDYNRELISKGGGVFSRQDKEIKLSAPVRKMLDVEDKSMNPQALISAILRMPVDLLWNGGIGTYCKAGSESNADVGDRANNSVRINASELRCKVVGEGGNLGFTQLARIEYALNGGRITTDFIDNSGGVNCSDREVNIKILLNLVMEEKKLTLEKRNSLLHDMTDEVAALVLKDNYLQSLALSIMESRATERINEHAYIIRMLEDSGHLDRNLEYLPNEEEIADRSNNNQGLTRPELATLLAYSKIVLYNQLLDSPAPEDEYLANELDRYFPEQILTNYNDFLKRHRLYREIASMLLTNSIIHRMGPTFIYRMQEETGASIAKVARAYTIARDVFDIRSLWHAIEEMDHNVPAQVQYSMIFETGRGLKHVSRWLLQRPGRSLDISDSLATYRPGVTTLINNLEEVLTDPEHYEQETLKLMNLKVPRDIAARIAGLDFMHSTLDIVEIASQSNFDVTGTAKAYFSLGVKLSLNRLQNEIENLKVEGHWQAVARGTLRENLYNLHRELMLKVIATSAHSNPIEAVEHWLNKHKSRVKHAHNTLEDMYASGQLDFATLSVALQIIRRLTSAENKT